MKNCEVTVVVITYGHQDYIQQTLQGILNQECNFSFEVIISNDNSPDATDEVIQQTLKNYKNPSNIHYFYHTNNLGMMKNFEFVLKKASGNYIAVCDGDDYWTDNSKLQKQYDYHIENKDIVFSFHNAKRYDEATNSFYPYVGLEQFQDKKVISLSKLFVRGGGTFPTSSAMFKKELIDDFPVYFHEYGVTDTPLLYHAITKGNIGYLADAMVVYRSTLTNWSSKNANFEVKYKHYNQKKYANSIFNKITNYAYNKYVNINNAHLTYQVIYAYCEIQDNLFKRFEFFLKHIPFLRGFKIFKALFRVLFKK